MVMEAIAITSEHQQRAQKAARKWNLLHPTRERRSNLGLDPNLPAPVIAEGRCQADPGCIFPPMIAGRCRQHARDVTAEGSSVGTAHGLLLEAGFIESEPRRCRSRK